jgi:hypothetical protein
MNIGTGGMRVKNGTNPTGQVPLPGAERFASPGAKRFASPGAKPNARPGAIDNYSTGAIACQP